MSLVEQVAKTIDKTAGHKLRGQDGIWRVDPRAMAQAVLEELGFVTCQTCNGSGRPNETQREIADRGYRLRCPDCGGLGVVPSDTMTERAKVPMLDTLAMSWSKMSNLGTHEELMARDDFNEMAATVARAALLAAIGETPDV